MLRMRLYRAMSGMDLTNMNRNTRTSRASTTSDTIPTMFTFYSHLPDLEVPLDVGHRVDNNHGYTDQNDDS